MRKRSGRDGAAPPVEPTNSPPRLDAGVTVVEYAVLLGLFGAALIAAIAFVLQGLATTFDGATGGLEGAATAAPSVTAAPSPTPTTPSPTPTESSASPTGSPSTPAGPAPLGIRWAEVAFNAQPNYACTFENPADVQCTATSAGNRATFSAAVEIWGRDASTGIEVPALNPGGTVSVDQTTTGGGGSTTTSGSMSIPGGAAKTAGRYTLELFAGQPNPTTITATAVVDGVTYRVSTVLSR